MRPKGAPSNNHSRSVGKTKGKTLPRQPDSVKRQTPSQSGASRLSGSSYDSQDFHKSRRGGSQQKPPERPYSSKTRPYSTGPSYADDGTDWANDAPPQQEWLSWDDNVPSRLNKQQSGSGVSAFTLGGGPQPISKRKRLTLISLIVVLLVACTTSTIATVSAYGSYQHDMALAKDGAIQAQAGMALLKKYGSGSLDPVLLATARKDFVQAAADFDAVAADLNSVTPAADVIPHYGAMLGAGRRLAPLAATLSHAGIVGCDAIQVIVPHLKNSLQGGAGLTNDDMKHLAAQIQVLSGLIDTAQKQINTLQPDDTSLAAGLGSTIAKLRGELPGIKSGVALVQNALPALSGALGIGTPANYLVEVLDSTELRPGGGFVGNYGIATVNGGALKDLHISDTYLLDRAYIDSGNGVPMPDKYSWFPFASLWGLRDSNLEADFPTVAHDAEQLYHTEGGTDKLQGVIAITPWMIVNALKLTGPIDVPEFGETVTAQNLVARIHYHQLAVLSGQESNRKVFTANLFKHFYARVKEVASKQTPAFAKLLIDSVRNKDMQIYLDAPSVEALLQKNGIASSIQAPQGDSIFVVDANIGANKVNFQLRYTLHDAVSLDDTGTATHTTTLTYTWPVSAENTANMYGPTRYRDYVRVYTPPNSTLISQSGWDPQGESKDFQRHVWAGVFIMYYGDTASITLKWRVPKAATLDSSGWHYTHLVQRQAGVFWKLNLDVALPKCGHFVSATGGLTQHGTGPASVSMPLNSDDPFSVTYTCK